MQNINLSIRQAVLNAITPIVWQSKNIYSFADFAQYSAQKPQALIPNGVGKTYEAYIILLNQNSNLNDQNKCTRNDQASIQIQVTTKFPSGTGGSTQAEQIAELILNKLYPVDKKHMAISLQHPLYVWKSQVELVKNLNYDDEVGRTFITQLVISCQVSQ